LRDVHVATMNLINVGAGVWDCDFSPEFKDFERPEYLSSPSVVMINGTLVQSWKLWNRGEMNKTADMMRRKGMYVVNIFWENNSYDVVLDKADRHLNSPEPDEVLGLMAHADVVISNDTGMAHLRALFKKPQIVNWVIGSTKLHKQLNPYARIVIGKCSAGRTKDQCYGEKYYRICNDKICQNISALEVVKEANEMLGLYSNIRY